MTEDWDDGLIFDLPSDLGDEDPVFEETPPPKVISLGEEPTVGYLLPPIEPEAYARLHTDPKAFLRTRGDLNSYNAARGKKKVEFAHSLLFNAHVRLRALLLENGLLDGKTEEGMERFRLLSEVDRDNCAAILACDPKVPGFKRLLRNQFRSGFNTLEYVLRKALPSLPRQSRNSINRTQYVAMTMEGVKTLLDEALEEENRLFDGDTVAAFGLAGLPHEAGSPVLQGVSGVVEEEEAEEPAPLADEDIAPLDLELEAPEMPLPSFGAEWVQSNVVAQPEPPEARRVYKTLNAKELPSSGVLGKPLSARGEAALLAGKLVTYAAVLPILGGIGHLDANGRHPEALPVGLVPTSITLPPQPQAAPAAFTPLYTQVEAAVGPRNAPEVANGLVESQYRNGPQTWQAVKAERPWKPGAGPLDVVVKDLSAWGGYGKPLESWADCVSAGMKPDLDNFAICMANDYGRYGKDAGEVAFRVFAQVGALHNPAVNELKPVEASHADLAQKGADGLGLSPSTQNKVENLEDLPDVTAHLEEDNELGSAPKQVWGGGNLKARQVAEPAGFTSEENAWFASGTTMPEAPVEQPVKRTWFEKAKDLGAKVKSWF